MRRRGLIRPSNWKVTLLRPQKYTGSALAPVLRIRRAATVFHAGIGDLRLADIPLRDFAGGKHGQRAALAQPCHRLLQGLQILIR